ncbi:hypothetical protein JTE90_000225 [Oedothorax gibbosus]|uniref:Glutamate receptor n=1 Tax=Oedothorax gibbosus TaxID=931172 RepID=A0AAV6VA27_9ARAC|nr:hypothetical protein JTE90_000225 [Oedothorax gibbosus]
MSMHFVYSFAVVLYGDCDAPVTNILHLLRKSVGLSFFEGDHQTKTNFKNKEAKSLRHDISDACHWVSEGSVAVFAVTGKGYTWGGIDTTAHDYNLPHLVTSDPCTRTCATPSFDDKPWQKEIAVFEYLKNEYLQDVIVIQEGNDVVGGLLSSLLASNGVRVSHIHVGGTSDAGPSFLRNEELFFDTWNLADLTEEGRMLVSLGDGEVADEIILKLLSSSIHKMRTKVLVSGSPSMWQERLLGVTAYEVDLTLVSGIGARAADCPAAFEIMSTKSNVYQKIDETCSALTPYNKTLGETILKNVQASLLPGRCCGQSAEYTIWRSFPAENGTQRLRPVAVWANDTGLMRMEPLHLQPLHLRIALLQYRPFVTFNITDGKVVLEDCVLKEILRYVGGRLNFSFSFVAAPEDNWGTKSGNEWTGAIGMIVKGEADVIPYLTITQTRFEAVQFTEPLTSVAYGILIKFPEEPPRALLFLRLYKTEVWLLLFLSALVMSYILCKLHTFSWRFRNPKETQKHLCSFVRCLWLVFGIMLQQGGTHLPVTTSGRLLLATWWLSVMVITTTYSANLIAFLAIPDIHLVVRTLEDLALHKTVNLVIKEGCPVLEDFQVR